MIPYLGLQPKYENLLNLTRLYYDENSFAEKDAHISLQYCDDPIIHNLFIAIIELINFFCVELEKLVKPEAKDKRTLSRNGDRLEEATKKKLQAKFDGVCEQMNDAKREEALFMVL